MSQVSLTASNANGSSTTLLTLDTGTPLPQMPAITIPKTATATVGVPFTFQPSATGKPANYFVTSPSNKGTEPPDSSLPPGMSYDTKTGLITGTPAASGTYTLQVAAMNDAGVSSAQMQLIINDK